jgi:hydrogenase expression/formation protein HypC
MCLGIPGRIVAWINRDPLFALASVEFDGVERDCQMACVPEARLGDFVMVHAGVAICLVDEGEAMRTMEEFERIRELSDHLDNTSGGSG